MKVKELGASRIAFISSIVASLLLKIACDKRLEMLGGKGLTPQTVYPAMLCWIGGSIAVFVVWNKAVE